MKINKYDYIFSIGEACSCALSLKLNDLRRWSGPFDWLWGASLIDRANIIINDFKSFTDKDLLEPVDDPTTLNQLYINKLTDIRFNHDFPRGSDFDSVYPEFQEKYRRRINRFLDILKSKKKVLLVYLQRPVTPWLKNYIYNSNDEILEAAEIINTKYDNVTVLYINHNEELKDFEIKLQKINNYLFMAECFNYDRNNKTKGNDTSYQNVQKILNYFTTYEKAKKKAFKTLIKAANIFYKDKPQYKRILFFKFYKKQT